MKGKSELTILPELFFSEPDVMRWKVDFNIFTTSFYGGIGFGKSSVIIGLNQLPFGGTCNITPLTGFSLFKTFMLKFCRNILCNQTFFRINISSQIMFFFLLFKEKFHDNILTF